jgi:RHS repeat-associated protein
LRKSALSQRLAKKALLKCFHIASTPIVTEPPARSAASAAVSPAGDRLRCSAHSSATLRDQSERGPTTTYTYAAGRGTLAGVRGSINFNISAVDGAGQPLTRSTVAPSASSGETRTYDAAGRVKSVDGPVYDATISYHPDGQIATVTGSGTAPKVKGYTYDDAGRLTGETVSQNGATLSTVAYAWDGDGNRTSTTTAGQPAVTATFDAADQLTSTSDGMSYDHTADGKLRTANDVSYTYNGFGDLVAATSSGSAVGYIRDAFGRMAGRAAGGTPTSYGYDGASSAIRTARTGTGPTTSTVRDPDGGLLGVATVGVVTQQAWRNMHGDLAALKDDTAATVRWQADYNPFGTLTSASGSAALPLTYQSMFADGATGFVDMGARQYDPTAGRFTSRDTVVGSPSSPTTLNRFLYANGDPINYHDPDGRWPEWLDEYAGWWWSEWQKGLAAEGPTTADDDAIDYVGRLLGSAITSTLAGVAGTFELGAAGLACAKTDDEQACSDWSYASSYEGVKQSLSDTLGNVRTCGVDGSYESCGIVVGAVFGLKGLRGLPSLTPDLRLPDRPRMPDLTHPVQTGIPALTPKWTV